MSHGQRMLTLIGAFFHRWIDIHMSLFEIEVSFLSLASSTCRIGFAGSIPRTHSKGEETANRRYCLCRALVKNKSDHSCDGNTRFLTPFSRDLELLVFLRGRKLNPCCAALRPGAKRFWVIIITLSVAALLSALENSVVTTTLPFIVAQLDLGTEYI